ncbi:hypothetical protein ACSBR1_035458 [Camellia fascicularis]
MIMDNKWNQGILNCVPFAFINALIPLMKRSKDASVSSLPPMFWFLPIRESLYPELNDVKEKIKEIVIDEEIIPCEPYIEKKPSEVADQFFVPNITQEALQLYSKKQTIRERLLNEVKVEAINVYEYADLLTNSLTRDHKLSVDYADFFYHSLSENYLPE